MGGVLAFVYGAVSYLIFFGAFLYAIGFVGNLFVPKSIDTGAPATFAEALAVNAPLLGLFAAPTSSRASPDRRGKIWTRPRVVRYT